MIAEVSGVRAGAEQAVQRRDFMWNRLAYLFRVGQVQLLQFLDLIADRLAQPGSSLAGGGRQANGERRALAGDGLNLEQGQQANDSGGLAGAGAAGNDREGCPCAQRASKLLGAGRIVLAVRRRKQIVQYRA